MGGKIATLAAALALTGSFASAQTLNCSFPNQRVDGWIRGQVIIKMLGDGNATVFDSLINQVHGGPIPATITTDNDKRISLKWRLKQVELRHSFAPKMDYRMTVLKDTGAANINATAPIFSSYTNADRAGGNFGARGSCKIK
ncbi:hypothetical protein [Shimia sp. SDUM112013]|uniref:hypothetical protein n=1 Tax=Shimia sp. SDUM112013 TaxID=3136160 RepID=UPI0032EC1954